MGSHTIRVSDKVMSLIYKYQAPRESCSAVLERAFVAFEALSEVSQTLGPAHHLARRIEKDAETIRQGA